MKTKITLIVLTVVALLGAAVLSIGWVSSVYAAATPAELQQVDLHGDGPGRNEEDLAAALGITVDELDAAKEEARTAAIDQALAEGLITQAQAETLRERERGFGFGDRWLAQNGIDYQALLAGALGISVEDLQAAYQEAAGLAIDRAVAEGHLTEEEADLLRARQALFSNESFQTSLRSAFEAAVQQAVEDGVITQSQADQILSQEAGGNFFGGPGFSGGGRRGGHGGGRFAPDFVPEPPMSAD